MYHQGLENVGRRVRDVLVVALTQDPAAIAERNYVRPRAPSRHP